MEHQKYNQTGFGNDIVRLIELEVLKIANDKWKCDKCPPQFWVSLNNEDMKNQAIMITISHLGVKFTERLFPRTDSHYGYKSVLDQMINMYNQTM